MNCDTYKPDPERHGREQYAPKGEKLLIHLSNFRPVTRVMDCVRILAEVRKTADARLLMVGDGPERGPAEQLAHQLGVGAYVDFLGKRSQVEQLIRLADVLLMPSEMESFGLAALEAMSCAVPVVATRVGGVPELITHGQDGFLEQVGDIAGMGARVTKLLSDNALQRVAMAARAVKPPQTAFPQTGWFRSMLNITRKCSTARDQQTDPVRRRPARFRHGDHGARSHP